MENFTQHYGLVLPLDAANVDTDQIIPKQFLQKTTRTGFGQHLFNDWRYLDNAGKVDNPEFILNKPQYQGASILLTGENFGCGSSREHAPWSLDDYGFKVVIATSFADIFYGNCINNSLLPVQLESAQIDALFEAVAQDPACQVVVDLPQQQVRFNDQVIGFDIAPHHKNNLIKGLDAIGQTLELDAKIKAFEDQQPAWQY